MSQLSDIARSPVICHTCRLFCFGIAWEQQAEAMFRIVIVILYSYIVLFADLFYDGQAEPDRIIALIAFFEPFEHFGRSHLQRIARIAYRQALLH